MGKAANYKAPDIPNVSDYPQVTRELELICESCDQKDDYLVGRVLVHPMKIQPFLKGDAAIDDALSFSGIFYCKQCDAAGPRKVTRDTQMALLACLAVTLPDKKGEFGVQVGAMTLFDGTVTRSGAESEAYLKQKIDEEPENAFLWGRLGNLYDHAGLPEKAREAFEKSVHLDPGECESLYSLGVYHMDVGDAKTAAEYFESAVSHARHRRQRNPAVMKKVVRACLEHLFDLHNETEGEIPFPPKLELSDEAKSLKPAELHLLDFELPSEEGWELLTALHLTGRVPEPMHRNAAKGKPISADVPPEDGADDETPPVGGTIRGSKRVGRNDPCPCGSGKKHKRCCLKR